MFDPEWDDGCPSCTAGADEIVRRPARAPAHARHDRSRTCRARRSRKIEKYKAKRGWTFPWYSSFGSDFNYDFHVTLDESVAPVEYNFRTAGGVRARGEPLYTERRRPVEYPGRSSFLRVDDRVFHTYSVYARGLETMGGSYYLLDETALGRQEDWEEPKGRAEPVAAAVPNFLE